MSTITDENGINHIDGPPVRGFVIAEHPDGSGNRVEVVYHTLRYAGSKEDCEQGYKNIINLIISEMQDLVKVWENQFMLHPIIWWRKRLELIEDPENPGYWRF